ncbi:chemotaxis protein CheX [Mobiluncus mulieris]|uniref:Chemotaxis protein CheX n=1 Tax=Mobiluncus mulieris TaxID=2052 RepID=A0ABD4TSW9_9ACTO|nr:chemotaxis protein CheX [Mobiluncus mulieris]MCU9968001.1 chemotaxis protein CheX [Mobiluncus mulieris]MCU9995789.1 chemotaxis protein CheX [Mobiluncus mulieris]NMW74726.1 chemotaxis protein CheX [Mobiluncus mulieris]NMW81038.1 chemotaxis protein CheX [Mobiluncus mulieris]NMX00903.1 chemotaxis protein CheX [Mobiluncus mulieris]
MQDQISQAVSMIATELFYALIDKMPDTVFEWEGDIEEFKHPIYSWVDSNGNQRIRALISMEKATSEELTRAMYTIGSEDPVTQDDIHDAFGEIANVIGGNLKSVIEDTGNLTIPQVSLDKPWVSESPLASLTLNWRGKFLVVSVSDLALEPQD